MKQPSYLLSIFLFLMINLSAQDTIPSQDSLSINKESPTNLYFGTGAGINYGGLLGLQVKLNVYNQMDIFLGIGYNSLKFGFNFGGSFILIDHGIIRPKATIMYGNNAVISGVNDTEYNNSYNGLSVGIAFELRLKKTSRSYLSIGAYYIRQSEAFRADYEKLDNDSHIQFYNKPRSYTFSLGYHFYIGGL